MRWSQLFIPTLREDPAEAELISHKLLMRAGYIRKVAAGVYNYLPLMQMVINNISRIVREEMNRQGRIFDKDWSHYDFNHVVFRPMNMSCETLHLGVAWILQQFFKRRRITQRIWKSLRYLHTATILRAMLPLNLGYRHRLTVDGTFQRGKAFIPLMNSHRASSVAV